MYPGSLPLIFKRSVPGQEKMFNVRRCSMYTGAQFDRFHFIHVFSLYHKLKLFVKRIPYSETNCIGSPTEHHWELPIAVASVW